MSSEVEKWIATWLDSASERGYQHAFVTALLLEGHEVLLNTSHNSLELGKDVIARGPDKKVYAYQLKGNPAGRYSMGDWHSGFQQVQQLVNMPIPSVLVGRIGLSHVPIVVTNGEVMEDVQHAVDSFNRLGAVEKPNRNDLTFLTRGQILHILYKHSKGIWPADIESEISILRFLSATGQGELDIAELSRLIKAMLRWDDKPSRRALTERVAGSCLVTTIAISRWIDSGNLYEAVRGLTCLLGILYCFTEKYGTGLKATVKILGAIRSFIFSRITELEDFIVGLRTPLLSKNIFAEFAYFHSRKMLLYGVVAANLLERSRRGEDISLAPASDIFRGRLEFPFLEGEYVVPSALAYFWATEHVSGKRDGDLALMSMLDTILAVNGQEGAEANLASPYHGLVDVARSKYRRWLGFSYHALDRDSAFNSSWFAKSIFYMVARRNWKRHCRTFWPQLTRMAHKKVVLTDVSEFAFWRSAAAVESTEIIAVPQTWDDVIAHCQRPLSPAVPGALKDDPVVCLLTCMFLPFRMNDEIVASLDRSFSGAWY